MRSVAWLILCIVVTPVTGQSTDTPDFGRDVLPILSSKCWSCHGPDPEGRHADLRLDDAREAVRPRDDGAAIVPGDPAASLVMARIKAVGASRMPPEDAGKSALKPGEIAVLEAWIRGGAEYRPHWAFVPRRKPTPPAVRDSAWVRTPVDRFVLAPLEASGTRPAPREEPGRLLRRLSFALTGLPPSKDEIDRFVADPSPRAWSAAVERRLSGPRYAEHWTRHWMDLARYADSAGYEKDAPRSIWRWKEWVLEAFASGMPFDVFTRKQIAGDLLPGATDEDRIATAFHRNTLTNDEGGTDDEEFRVAAVVDRVNTVFETWTGLSMGCAQCHTHRYDPITIEDYYGAYAYFNQTEDADRGDEAPVLRTPPFGVRGRPDTRPEDWPTTPVLRELPAQNRRETRVLLRGSFASKGALVAPHTPTALPGRPPVHGDRRDLAEWILAPENPLTARVIANRWFEKIVGRAIVDSVGNFGTQGASPTHPELLDWLAEELIASGWDLRHLIRLIVESSTFAQSARTTPETLRADPENRRLARGSRVRLDAEEMRDAVLEASGLLHHRFGGPPVRPPQPDLGLSPYSGLRWEESDGADRRRRGVYVFWRRSQPYAPFSAFDATPRNICTSKRERTNTPLQALALMNDPVVIEAAQALARVVLVTESNDAARLETGFVRTAGRRPFPHEASTLADLLAKGRARFASAPSDAVAFASDPLGPLPTGLAPSEAAAWTLVAQVLLTMEEAVVR